jgi:DNA topoisomerase-1
MNLLLVESAAHARVLTDVLGDGWRVEPCHGLLRMPLLPVGKRGSSLTVPLTFSLTPGTANLVRRLKRALRECQALCLATPPGRLGELIAWHAAELLDPGDKPVRRIELASLAPDAIRAAFAAPRALDRQAVDAALAEQLVTHLPAGRLSMAAELANTLARLPRQPAAWTAQVVLQHQGKSFQADVRDLRGRRLVLTQPDQHERLGALLTGSRCLAGKPVERAVARPAPAPFDAAELMATAERQLGLAPERVLMLLGTLFDAGWITHPEATLPPDLSAAAKRHVVRAYGAELVATEGLWSRGIAPADIDRLPEDLPGDGAALYGLIWRQFLAAHMLAGQDCLRGISFQALSERGTPWPLRLTVAQTESVVAGWRTVIPSQNLSDPLPDVAEGDALTVQNISFTPVDAPTTSSVPRLIRAGLSPQAAVTAAGQAEKVQDAEAVGGIDPDLHDLVAAIDHIAAGMLTLAEWLARLDALLARRSDAPGEHAPILLRPVHKEEAR